LAVVVVGGGRGGGGDGKRHGLRLERSLLPVHRHLEIRHLHHEEAGALAGTPLEESLLLPNQVGNVVGRVLLVVRVLLVEDVEGIGRGGRRQ
jgi:hypothetical protein